MKAKIYVAGPYTKGDVAVNVRSAFEAANKLADFGFAPFVPHGTHFWHIGSGSSHHAVCASQGGEHV